MDRRKRTLQWALLQNHYRNRRITSEQSLPDGKQKDLQMTRHSDVFDVLTEKARSIKTAPENQRNPHLHMTKSMSL